MPLRVRCDELTVPASSGTVKMPGLSGSASLKNGTLAVTLTNPSHDSPLTARIRLASGTAAEARGVVLTHAEMTAHNTFDRPEEVKLAPLRGDASAAARSKWRFRNTPWCRIEVRVS